MTNDDCPSEGPPEVEGMSQGMEKALGRARKATEELPPLEELAALQEAMTGLSEMGALLEKMRLACLCAGPRVERPGAGPDHVDAEGA